MCKKFFITILTFCIMFSFSACSTKDSYYIADDNTQYLVYRDSDGDIVINDSGKLLVYTLNENNKKIKSDSGEYLTEYVNFNGQVVSDGIVETMEMRFTLPSGFEESRENPGYFFNSAYHGDIFIDYYPNGMENGIKAHENTCEDLLESFGSEVFSYKKYTVEISGIECTAFSSLSTTSEYYKNTFNYYIPYDTGYYVINCTISTDYKNKVKFDSFAESIVLKGI